MTNDFKTIRKALPGVHDQVLLTAAGMSDAQKRQPEWLWYENDAGLTSMGRWQRDPGATPYVRLDMVLAALDTLAAELARLRANALDLSAVPEGMGWVVLHSISDGNIMAAVGTPGRIKDAIADTPAAALAAAIERVRG